MDSQVGRIVVGYDGSALSAVAVDWAAAESERRGLPLSVLHALDIPRIPGSQGPRPWVDLKDSAITEVADEGVQRARKTAETVDIYAVTQVERTATSLVENSREAAMLVVGTRGHGNVAGAWLGSVAFDVSAHTFCPVVVVRGDATQLPGPDRPVTVGVDGSEDSEAAIAFAADAAARAEASLIVVTAFSIPGRGECGLAVAYRGEEIEEPGGPVFGTIAERPPTTSRLPRPRSLVAVIRAWTCAEHSADECPRTNDSHGSPYYSEVGANSDISG